ncbi:AAA family ATPase [Bdellovibrionota bacterium FG-2]
MIQAYFGFKKLPFPKELKTTAMYESFDLKEAFARLQFLKQNRGIFCLTGEPGSGKTSVLRRFVEELNPQTHLHAYTPHATVSKIELYRQINGLLNLPNRMHKSALFAQIQKAVTELHEHHGKTPVIILDECHLMDCQTLQELILITNFQMDSKVPFLLILIGQPDFRETLKRRMHEPLNQRITLRYHMAGIMDVEETRAYIHHHLKLAGRSDPLFEEAAFEVLHRMALGLPRKVGNLSIAAMTLAMVKRDKAITPDHIIKAADGI